MSTYSFIEVTKQIDPLYHPLSLRNLISRFRFLEEDSNKKTFRTIAQRLDNSKGVQKFKFLHYNTWLLAAPIKICDIIGDIGGWNYLISRLGISYYEVVTHFIANKIIDIGNICDKIFPPVVEVCGVSPNLAYDLCKATCKVTSVEAGLASYLLGTVGNSIDYFIHLFAIPCDVVIDVIGAIKGSNINFDLIMKPKPQMHERANEIGAEVFSYDIVSLVEVWLATQQKEVLSHNTGNPGIKVFYGPDKISGRFIGSGLMVFAPQLDIAGPRCYDYKQTGINRLEGDEILGKLVDMDNFATKGIQLSVISTNFGSIELYSTHLYSGGDGVLSSEFLGLNNPTENEKNNIRRKQVEELVNFISATHNPQNIAIIAGDFNVPADIPYDSKNVDTEYNYLISKLKDIKSGQGDNIFSFDDWWALEPFKLNSSNGRTNRNGGVDTFDSNCKVFPLDPSSVNPNDYYCDESKKDDESPTGSRIDYIFIEQPTPTHTFNLDVSRVRRRAFKRTSDHTSPEYFLSDHLGLEVTLFASPK